VGRLRLSGGSHAGLGGADHSHRAATSHTNAATFPPAPVSVPTVLDLWQYRASSSLHYVSRDDVDLN
jgi:hypothetical protein